MPYAVKFYAYIFIANVLAVVIVGRWVKPFGFVASLAFGLGHCPYVQASRQVFREHLQCDETLAYPRIKSDTAPIVESLGLRGYGSLNQHPLLLYLLACHRGLHITGLDLIPLRDIEAQISLSLID
jgi:hypothetical protein